MNSPEPAFKADDYVYRILFDLGMEKPFYFPETMTDDDIRRGKEIVLNGHTDEPSGGKSKYVSVYYVCTNCHNTVIEDPDLTKSDPETRLAFAVNKNISFLQGTTFYGTANRESWYNDDYYKKYGDLVKPANKDIREAIQLCALECSKGRVLEDWEEHAILSYLYSISYKLSDLFSEKEIEELNRKNSSNNNSKELIALIKSKYALKSPATFVEPPYENGAKLPQGNPENGKSIYNLSCQTCHKPYGCSDVVFDNSKKTFNKFEKDFSRDDWWLFKAVRHGFSGYAGHEPYMPHFTAERMTDKQVMDLRAYLMIGETGR
ncbi:MAG: c-type cytochrome [Chitinophagales bacterium]